MEEKIFGDLKNNTIEELVKRINEIVGQKFAILDEENDIEKWNAVPKLLLLNENKKNKTLSFVEFMDSLLVPLEEKAMYVISLCGLLEFSNIDLEDYDDGSLFTIADYYQNSSIDEIKNTIGIIGNKEILLSVRKKALDLEVRKKILLNIVNRALNDKIDITNKKEVTKFIAEVIKELDETEYYDLVK